MIEPLETCDRCKFWDSELAINLDQPFAFARGECTNTKNGLSHLLTHSSSMCSEFEGIDQDISEGEEQYEVV